MPRGRPRSDALRPALNRDDVLEAGRMIARRSSLQSLTIAAVADYLGVTAPAIYHYVEGRDGLRSGVLDRILRGIAIPSPGEQPVDRVCSLVLAIRRTLLQYPGAAQAWLDQPSPTGWEWINRLLDALADLGLEEDAARQTFRALFAYTMGQLLLPVPVDLSPDGHGDVNEAEFRTGLSILVTGLVRELGT